MAVSTIYDSLSANAIDCTEFVAAVEEGLGRLPGFGVGQFEAEDHFFVHIGFDEIDDDLRAVSIVVGLHAITSLLRDEADYFLRQYTGHFNASQEASEGQESHALVELLYKEITRRVDQGWLER